MEDAQSTIGALCAEVDRLRRRLAELQAGPDADATNQGALPRALAEAGDRPRCDGASRLELRSEDILDLSGVMFVAVAADERIALVNRIACHILGCSEQDALGRNWFDSFVPEHQRQVVRRSFHRIIAGDLTPLEFHENQVLTTSGQARLIAWHNALLHDAGGRVIGTLSSGVDVTDQRKAAEALRESEERFRALFESAHDGMLVADAETRRFVTGNPAICSMLGRRPEEIQLLRIEDIHPLEALPGVLDAFERLLSREFRVARDVPVRRKDGSVFPADISSAQVVLGGRSYRLGIFRDVTDRLQAEEERFRLEAKVRETQKLESLGVLAGGIAHDFNNLLVGILGHADLALAELRPGSAAAASVAEVVTAARRAAELCQQMLAYSGRGRFVLEDIDLSALVREMAHLLEVTSPQRAALNYRLADDLPPIHGDASQIRQVVMNLITNASEAIGEERGAIRIRTGTMACDRKYLAETYVDDDLEPGKYVMLEVADTGCGMDARTRTRLFEPFYTTKFTGRGLGLAAVLGIVRGHRGAIAIRSQPGLGSTFTVLLPPARQAPEATAATSVTREEWSGSGLALLVDDDDTVLEVARQMLESIGFSVLTAGDGEEAVALFFSQAAEISCVILDLTMPRMDGETTLRALRAVRPAVPVLISSGYSEPDTLAQSAAGGPVAFIQKPYRTSELRDTLRALLTRPK